MVLPWRPGRSPPKDQRPGLDRQSYSCHTLLHMTKREALVAKHGFVSKNFRE